MTNIISMMTVGFMVSVAAFDQLCRSEPEQLKTAKEAVDTAEKKLSSASLVFNHLKKRLGKIIDLSVDEPIARMRYAPEKSVSDSDEYIDKHYIQRDPKSGIYYLLVYPKKGWGSIEDFPSTLIGFKPRKEDEPNGELEIVSKTSVNVPSGTTPQDWFIEGENLYTVSHNWGGFYFDPVEFKTYISRFNIATGEEKHSRNFGETLDLALRPLPDNKLLVTFGELRLGSPETITERESGHAYFFSRDDLLRFISHQRTEDRPLQVKVDETNALVTVGYTNIDTFDYKGNRIKKIERTNQK